MEFTAILVEENSDNYYKKRGFVTSSYYDIIPSTNIHLPKIECLMINEVVQGTLKRMYRVVDYSFYKSLSENRKIENTKK